MVIRKLVADALDTWREGERLLGELPHASGERATVSAALRETRDLYNLFTRHAGFDDEEIEAARQRVDAARRAIRDVRSRPPRSLQMSGTLESSGRP